MHQLGELKSLVDRLAGTPTQLLAVSIDTRAQSRQLLRDLAADTPDGRREGADFALGLPLLEDAQHRVIDRYGLLNPDGRGWPHPATYVIDREGIVRWKFVEVDYRKRATNEMVLDALDKLR